MSFYIQFMKSVFADLPYTVIILQKEQIVQYQNFLYLHLLEINALARFLTYLIKKPNYSTGEVTNVLTCT